MKFEKTQIYMKVQRKNLKRECPRMFKSDSEMLASKIKQQREGREGKLDKDRVKRLIQLSRVQQNRLRNETQEARVKR